MKLIPINYTNPTQRYYFQSFYDNVIPCVYAEGMIPDFYEFFSQISDPNRSGHWYCIVAVEDAKVVAGITAEHMEYSGCNVIEYLQTRPETVYLTEDLLKAMMNLLREKGCGSDYTFIEVVPGIERVAGGVYARHCKVLDFEYVTPNLTDETGGRFEGLNLAVVDFDGDAVDGKTLVAFITEYFQNSYKGDWESCIPDVGDSVEAIEL